ncbi:MAG: hypothetical protein LBD02_04330 [Christensenellaceae bacterium]|jgi:hypothetical protein|nr:hypothetical protein [Christensenellaceae bacterium]
MKKIALFLCLALLMLTALAGCGGPGDPGVVLVTETPTASESPETSATPETSPTEIATPEPAATPAAPPITDYKELNERITKAYKGETKDGHILYYGLNDDGGFVAIGYQDPKKKDSDCFAGLSKQSPRGMTVTDQIAWVDMDYSLEDKDGKQHLKVELAKGAAEADLKACEVKELVDAFVSIVTDTAAVG